MMSLYKTSRRLALLPSSAPWLLVKGAHLYEPNDLGPCDLLAVGSQIAMIDSDIKCWSAENGRVLNAEGLIMIPGLIDAHQHVLGGGGEGGPGTRQSEIKIETIVQGGITTVVGVLGYDSTSKDVRCLLGKSQELRVKGISAYMLVGAYHWDSSGATLTGSITDDIVFVEQVLGIKIAISDHRGLFSDWRDLSHIAAQARIGGLISGKCGIVNVHLGYGINSMKPLFEIIENTKIPANQFYPTHVNSSQRNLEDALRFGKLGGMVDITACIAPHLGFDGSIRPSDAVIWLVEQGINADGITFTSDGNGNWVKRDNSGNVVEIAVISVSQLIEEVRDLIVRHKYPISDALRLVTANPAKVLNLKKKGHLSGGADADFVLLTPDFKIKTVVSKGKVLYCDGKFYTAFP